MNKTAIMAAGCVAALVAVFLVLMYRTDSEVVDDEPVVSRQSSEGISAGGPAAKQGRRASDAAGEANEVAPSGMSKEEFGRLSPEEQDEVIEQFIGEFWRGELGSGEEPREQRRYLSLDVFSGPYMLTIKEGEIWQLSPEDRERAMAEVMVSCQEYRREYLDLVARAQESIANNDYLRAEAPLISGLERARELTADREGLLITRLVGIACQAVCLKEMEMLYLKTSEASKLARTRLGLEQLEVEKRETRDAALRAAETRGDG